MSLHSLKSNAALQHGKLCLPWHPLNRKSPHLSYVDHVRTERQALELEAADVCLQVSKTMALLH